MSGGLVQLTPSRGPAVAVILNKEPDRTLGVGGFESTERALRRPAKWYKEIPDDTIALDCTLDVDALPGPPIEQRIAMIRDMGLAGDRDEPPTIALYGDVWDNDKAITWVVTTGGVTLGERLWNGDGTLRRQQVSVSLERYTALSEVKAISVKSTRVKGKRRRRTIKTRGFDTVRAVALRELGDATRWKDVVSWNKRLKGVDPDARLRTGTHLTIR